MNTVDHYQPCGDPFLVRPQSHIHVPAASAPQPPAEPIWSPLSECVRPERPLWPSSPGLYTPEGTSSSKAPPAWSWNSSITDPLHQQWTRGPHPHMAPHLSSLYLLQVMRPFLWHALHAFAFTLMSPSVRKHLLLPFLNRVSVQSSAGLVKAPLAASVVKILSTTANQVMRIN